MSEQRRGLLDSTRNLLDTALGLLQTRVELFATEIEEEKERLLSALIFGAASFVLICLGTIFLAITLTVLLWDEHRLLILSILSGVFLCAGAGALVFAVRNGRRRDRLFSASIAELERDRATLRGEE
jgi:uncharacterized membrane protein YqjE